MEVSYGCLFIINIILTKAVLHTLPSPHCSTNYRMSKMLYSNLLYKIRLLGHIIYLINKFIYYHQKQIDSQRTTVKATNFQGEKGF